MKKLLVALLTSTCALILTGCETTKGFGKDLQKVGEKIEQKAEENS